MSENKTLLKKLFDRIHMTKMEKNFINVKKLLPKLKMDFYLQFIGYQMTDHQYYCNTVYWKMFKTTPVDPIHSKVPSSIHPYLL